jgi:hypothetical protein
MVRSHNERKKQKYENSTHENNWPVAFATRFAPHLTVFVCFGLSPQARAVDPPPDGGYPNQNTAEGEDALFSLTTGVDNTANGFEALFNNTIGNFNTATGAQALFRNTGATATRPTVHSRCLAIQVAA